MGIGRRILDLARANLNALLDKAAGEAKVGELTDDELEAELTRRKERRLREDDARRAAGAAEAAARERAKARGYTPPPPRHPPRPRAPSAEARLRQLYATLETPYGSGFDVVKSNFRKLMRKYHPDVHAGHPEKLKAANAKAATISAAYAELEKLLVARR